MHKYIIKRIFYSIIIFFFVMLIIYAIMRCLPASYVETIARSKSMQPNSKSFEEWMEQLSATYNMDKGILAGYFIWLGQFFSGNFGDSWFYTVPVIEKFHDTIWLSFVMSLIAMFFELIIAIPLGIIAAVKHGSLIDNAAMILALLGLSIPDFWLGLMLIIYFSNKWGLLPSGGDEAGIKSLILPAITIGTGLMAALTRTTRSSMLDVIRKDYLRTARAKGALERRVIFRHALKNAMIPILTILGSQLTSILGGSVLTETVFTWPGVGRLVVDSINGRDVPTATGLLILKTIVMSFIVLIVDLLYAAVDPRVKARYSKGGKKKKA